MQHVAALVPGMAELAGRFTYSWSGGALAERTEY